MPKVFPNLMAASLEHMLQEIANDEFIYLFLLECGTSRRVVGAGDRFLSDVCFCFSVSLSPLSA